ncbi:MAG: hypothetical protein PHV28_07480 [Kiritimatiellae bacterium]|nr:hypothetical protein [Kiritimatiellia bacterium]
MDGKPIIFEDWEQALMTAVSPGLRRAYREAIVKFRYWLRQTGKSADIETFKEGTHCLSLSTLRHRMDGLRAVRGLQGFLPRRHRDTERE